MVSGRAWRMVIFHISLRNSFVDPRIGSTVLGNISGWEVVISVHSCSSILTSWHFPFPCIKWGRVTSFGQCTTSDSKRDTSEFTWQKAPAWLFSYLIFFMAVWELHWDGRAAKQKRPVSLSNWMKNNCPGES